MRPPRNAPTWSQRVQARTPSWALVVYAVAVPWWTYVGIDDLAAGGPLWKSLVWFGSGVGFAVLGVRALWWRSRVRAWDAAHPGEAPSGPTPHEAAAARRTRLRGWWTLAAVGVLALVVGLVLDGAARGALLVFAAVVAFVLVIEFVRGDRPAEQAVEPSPRVDA